MKGDVSILRANERESIACMRFCGNQKYFLKFLFCIFTGICKENDKQCWRTTTELSVVPKLFFVLELSVD